MSSIIKVLIVDDSALVRRTLVEILSEHSDIEIVGAATEPFAAVEIIRRCVPDVIILDVEMPKMDGLTFLRKIMAQRPIPVVICSTLVGDNNETHMRALEYGAVEIIQKPALNTQQFLRDGAVRFIDAVRAAAHADLRKLKRQFAAPAIRATFKPRSAAMARTTEKVIVVGASTGGTEAIKRFLEAMPLDCPAIVIVQHMPENFTRSFAQRMNQVCGIAVKEAEHGDSLLRGHALIAPGNFHMMVARSGARYHVDVKQGPLVSRHRPSVDVLFRSAAQYLGANGVGVILTGMGNDGASGLLAMRQAGATTFGQDEATSVVYGMPKAANELGAVMNELPLTQLPQAVLNVC
ncbi:two-component system chemotaxis response regulator CheB [Idiomarina fontislapidosi]|uniref:Protein-glutamate methylesterase/protein-glutamine glutaminase n=1 Tax=Idiomarina fontislapidosi TaxID=263723 RepID=A0A432YAW3_9GAMM|nr:chemotaxis response regulator protein-glutamate methylesterase [Idiomarina fontislapidosi]PYE35182.1 two-component system chemotaxis response regulator CheB [Idiomarina fontislapidosi]RUO58077.1 chemotaxis response regulator protein-glutamate methylesterase [Idiomarina fontislapidosi]|tara:strand:+ start:3813 stop:4862 length:1050 start_codon:yes stop_codon:yes gene_type:complete